MSGAREFVRVFVGIINKVNHDRMKALAEKFLRSLHIEYHRLDTHSQGFIVTFYSMGHAEEAVKLMDDRALADAVQEHVTARVLQDTEMDVAIITRMERELWVVPEWPVTSCDDDIERLVSYFNKLDLCPPVPSGMRWEKFLETLIFVPVFTEGGQAKYVIELKSPEAVVCAAGLNTPQLVTNPLKLEHRLALTVSTACHHKFRHDLYSTVLFVPDEWKTIFEQEKLLEWAGRALKEFKLGEKKTKVINTHAIQIFTDSEVEQDRLIGAVMAPKFGPLPLYKDVVVRAADWRLYLLYRMAQSELSVENQLHMEMVVYGVPEELAALHRAVDAGNQQDDNLTDAFYTELVQLRNPCEFTVWRDETFSRKEETMDYVDVFIFTERYQQSALKRTETIRLFQPQLENLIASEKAHTGLILNHHVSFDALGGIVFYLVFKRADAKKAENTIEKVKAGRICMTDVIQQNFGNKVHTSAGRGVGFSATFPVDRSQVVLDLVEISKQILA